MNYILRADPFEDIIRYRKSSLTTKRAIEAMNRQPYSVREIPDSSSTLNIPSNKLIQTKQYSNDSNGSTKDYYTDKKSLLMSSNIISNGVISNEMQ